MQTCHFQWDLPLSPRRCEEGRCTARGGSKGTVVEISNLTQLMILIVIVLLIFRAQQITSMIKSKIKRANVAKHPLNSMAVPSGPEGQCSDALARLPVLTLSDRLAFVSVAAQP